MTKNPLTKEQEQFRRQLEEDYGDNWPEAQAAMRNLVLKQGKDDTFSKYMNGEISVEELRLKYPQSASET